MRTIHEPAEVDRLATALRDPGRRDPWVLVTTPKGTTSTPLDVDDLARQLQGRAEVVLLATDAATYRLSDHMPEGTGAYGGAVRVYPPGVAWITDPWQSRFFLVHDADDAALHLPDIVATALSHGSASTALTMTAKPRARAVVRRIAVPGSTALVEVDGRLVPVHAEMVLPGVAIEWMLHVGQTFDATFDGGRLTLEPMRASEFTLLATFADGDATLGMIVEVDADHCVARLHPSVDVRVSRGSITSNPADRVDDYYSVGEVVPVRVRHRKGRLRLSLDDVDETDDLRPAVALTTDGLPWLELGRDAEVAAAERLADSIERVAEVSTSREVTDAVATAAPTGEHTFKATVGDIADEHAPAPTPLPKAPPDPAPRLGSPDSAAESASRPAPLASDRRADRSALQTAELTIAQLRAENGRLAAAVDTPSASSIAEADLLRRELRDAYREVRDLRRRNTELIERQRAAQRKLRKYSGRRDAGTTIAVRTDEEWVRVSIWLEWMRSFSAADRDAHPIPDYLVGPRFAESMRAHDDRVHAKSFRCAVRVLTGRDGAAEGGHVLRSGGGGAAAVTRADGATCWRYYVEQSTASARRLHVWKGAGPVELSKVGLHDDYEP